MSAAGELGYEPPPEIPHTRLIRPWYAKQAAALWDGFTAPSNRILIMPCLLWLILWPLWIAFKVCWLLLSFLLLTLVWLLVLPVDLATYRSRKRRAARPWVEYMAALHDRDVPGEGA